MQYVNSHVQSREIQIDELRNILNLEPHEYKLINDFFKYIIGYAHSEICTKTDITFNYRSIKESRKIIAVEFYNIHRKEGVPPAVMDLIPEKYRNNSDVLKNILQYLKSHGPEYVTEKLLYVTKRPTKNYGSYLFSVLENNYGEDFQSKQPKEDVPTFNSGDVFERNNKRYTYGPEGLKINKKILIPFEIQEAISNGTLTQISQSQLERERKEEEDKILTMARNTKIAVFLSRLPQDERKTLDDQFIEGGLNNFSKELIRSYGLDSEIGKALYFDWLFKNFRNKIEYTLK
jgi:hypothetical protein